jgi:hypothetical protein
MATTVNQSVLQRDGIPAIAILKGECPRGEALMPLVGQHLADKGVERGTIDYMQQRALLAPLIGHLLMQAPSGVSEQLYGLQASALPMPAPVYTGSRGENREIDQAIFRSAQHSGAHAEGGMRATTWRGAAGLYCGGGLRVPSEMRDIRILIIGLGAAGIFAGRALANAGMRNVVVLEKGGAPG